MEKIILLQLQQESEMEKSSQKSLYLWQDLCLPHRGGGLRPCSQLQSQLLSPLGHEDGQKLARIMMAEQ